jgi:hypothetical protein
MPNPYLNQLNRTQDILARGLGGIGDTAVRNRLVDLETAKERYGIGRQRTQDARQAKMDALQRPSLELASKKAQAELEAGNQPFRMGDLVNSRQGQNILAFDHFAAGELPDKIGKVFGGKYITKEEDPELAGNFVVEQDGKKRVLTRMEVQPYFNEINSVLMNNTDPIKRVETIKDQLQMSMQQAPDDPQLAAKIEQVDKWLQDPAAQIKAYEAHIERIANTSLPGTGRKENIARLERKVTRLRDALNKELDRKARERQARIKGARGKDMRGTLGKMVDDIHRIRSHNDKSYTKEQALEEAKAMEKDPRTAQMLLKIIEFADWNIEDKTKRDQVISQANDAILGILSNTSGDSKKTDDPLGIR